MFVTIVLQFSKEYLQAYHQHVFRCHYSDVLFYNKQHHAPHIHAECQGEQASYLIETGERISGKLPPNKEKLIQAWMLIHKEDLYADWELAVKGEEPFRIDPLR